MATQTKIEDLKGRIKRGEKIAINNKGTVHRPEDLANVHPAEKTIIKPQRWF